jgi:tetratricopeptide (TPR) repeat protein
MKLLLLFTIFANLALGSDVESIKALGNDSFKQKKYEESIIHYSSGLSHHNVSDEMKIFLYRNRGMAYYHLNNLDEANKNFFQAFLLDHGDSKTLHWLTTTKLRQNKFLEAIFYAGIRATLSKENSEKVIDNQIRVRQIIGKYSEILPTPIVKCDEITLAKSLCNYVYLLKEFCLIEDCGSFSAQIIGYARQQGALLSGIEQFWDKKAFVPLARQESPRHLAPFIGEQQVVVTPAVQGLPFYLAQKNHLVYVADIEGGQLKHLQEWRAAIKENRLEEFKIESYNNFIGHISDKSIAPLAQEAFNELYDPLLEFGDDQKIITFKGDIFSYVDSLLEDGKNIDMVFLSTILQFDKHLLPVRYLTMLGWLSRGTGVTMSVLRDSCVSLDFARLMIQSFDDVANVEFKLFEESPSVFHVKLTPKPECKGFALSKRRHVECH